MRPNTTSHTPRPKKIKKKKTHALSRTLDSELPILCGDIAPSSPNNSVMSLRTTLRRNYDVQDDNENLKALTVGEISRDRRLVQEDLQALKNRVNLLKRQKKKQAYAEEKAKKKAANMEAFLLKKKEERMWLEKQKVDSSTEKYMAVQAQRDLNQKRMQNFLAYQREMNEYKAQQNRAYRQHLEQEKEKLKLEAQQKIARNQQRKNVIRSRQNMAQLRRERDKMQYLARMEELKKHRIEHELKKKNEFLDMIQQLRMEENELLNTVN